MKRWKCLLALAMGWLLCLGVAHAQPLSFSLRATYGTVEIDTVELDGEEWLFLPAFAVPNELGLEWMDEQADEEGVRRAQKDGVLLHVMQSQNLRTVFLFSDDPIQQGRSYIENCERHQNETTGTIAVVDTNGRVDVVEPLRQLRGRGNGTWMLEKKPYQFKLENRLDLLKTGEPSEKNRTWVLLAQATDITALRPKLALDLGLEMGIGSSSRSEYVDLYYDGEYCGLYLLAEKVEIGDGRIEQVDYDKLLDAWNESELDLHTVASATNRLGNRFTYVENVADAGLTNAGAYLLEMESVNGSTLSDRCYFQMDDGSTIALKNPENASESMVRYISECLTQARRTLQNGGVNPETGRTIEDDFNVDAFARLALIDELSCNLDSFSWSSTWFILPAGETRFEPGPPWDFDNAWSYLTDGSRAGGRGLKERTGWLAELYQCKAFSDAMSRIYEQEMYPLIRDVLLGDQQGEYLHSIDSYTSEIEQANRMNLKRWNIKRASSLVYAESYEENIDLLKRFVSERGDWLYRVLVTNEALGADGIEIMLRVMYGYADSELDFWLPPWSEASVLSFQSEQIAEATETEYAVYAVEAVIAPEEGYAFEDPVVIVNGQQLQTQRQPNGTLRIAFTFEDPTYRPVDYYGDDIGLVYQYDFYIQREPQVLEICGDDPQAVMEYFCDEGMYLGHRGNPFFKPSEVVLYNPHLADMLGEDWQLYYWEFIAYGFEEGWLYNMDERFWPDVTDAL